MPIRTLIISLFVVCTISGCSKEQRPVGFPTLYPCQITITQGGQPLEGALVRLMPESGKSEWVISGKTDAGGVAKVSTHGKFSGAPEGTFKVCVAKTYETPSQFQPPKEDAPYEDWEAWRGQVNSEKRPRYHLVKPEYDDVRRTSHSIVVVKGKNRQTFDVGEAVEIAVQ
jgi:hypothetical protein